MAASSPGKGRGTPGGIRGRLRALWQSSDAKASWLWPAAGVLGLAALYKAGLVSEQATGSVAAVAIGLGPILASVGAMLKAVEGRAGRAALWAFGLVWALAAAYPISRVVRPGAALQRVTLEESKTVAVDIGAPRRLEVTVIGRRTEARGDSRAQVTLAVRSPAGQEEVSGEISREVGSLRVRQRTTTTVWEHDEFRRTLGRSHGPKVELTATRIDGALAGVTVELRTAPLPPWLVIALAGLTAAAALALEALFARRGVRSWVVAAVGTSLLFAWLYPDDAGRAAMVQPALGAGFLAALVGGGGGALVGLLIRLVVAGKRRPKARPR